MIYTVKQLSKISGVSVRTLHWYDKLGLLCAKRNEGNGYRMYDDMLVDRLQQILFYRELGLELSEIGILLDGTQSRKDALISYRQRLVQRLNGLQSLLHTLDKTILHEKGEYIMENNEKFEAFKKELIDKNEAQYGEEIRAKYGNSEVDSSNELLLSMGKEKFDEMQALGEEINALLKTALAENALPNADICKNIAQKHKLWLSYTWKKYSVQAHRGLCEMYIADSRFTDYYDNAAGKGAARLLHDAVAANCQ